MKSVHSTHGHPSEFIIRFLPGSIDPNQGSAVHVKSGEERCFHSYLELVLFIQEMLEQHGPDQQEGNMRSWPQYGTPQNAEGGE